MHYLYCQYMHSVVPFSFLFHVDASQLDTRLFPYFSASFSPFIFIQILWTVFKDEYSKHLRTSGFFSFLRKDYWFCYYENETLFSWFFHFLLLFFPLLIQNATKYVFTFSNVFPAGSPYAFYIYFFVRINVNSITYYIYRIELFFLGAKFTISTYEGGKKRAK